GVLAERSAPLLAVGSGRPAQPLASLNCYSRLGALQALTVANRDLCIGGLHMRQRTEWAIVSSAYGGRLRPFCRWMLLPIVLAAWLPFDANADFTVCNKSSTYPLT